MNIILNFILCLIITIVTEGIVIYMKYQRKDYVYYSFLCNVLTNPMLNLILCLFIWIFGDKFYIFTVAILEIIVVFAEAYVYKVLCKFSSKKALKLSILLNLSSYLMGVGIMRFSTYR